MPSSDHDEKRRHIRFRLDPHKSAFPVKCRLESGEMQTCVLDVTDISYGGIRVLVDPADHETLQHMQRHPLWATLSFGDEIISPRLHIVWMADQTESSDGTISTGLKFESMQASEFERFEGFLAKLERP